MLYLEPKLCSARVLLEKIKLGLVHDFDRCRDLYRRGWKGLSTPESFEDALEILKEHGWLRTEILSAQVGRKSDVIRLHPSFR